MIPARLLLHPEFLGPLACLALFAVLFAGVWVVVG